MQCVSRMLAHPLHGEDLLQTGQGNWVGAHWESCVLRARWVRPRPVCHLSLCVLFPQSSLCAAWSSLWDGRPSTGGSFFQDQPFYRSKLARVGPAVPSLPASVPQEHAAVQSVVCVRDLYSSTPAPPPDAAQMIPKSLVGGRRSDLGT